MSTEKQIAANRQNAKYSTGPQTERGKRRSRRNAIRHGLTAETVIDDLEDSAAYKTLQRAIYADYRPRSNFELQLVARLVSLLWRLRRALAIETGLFDIQAKATRTRNALSADKLDLFYHLIPSLSPTTRTAGESACDEPVTKLGVTHTDIAQSFLQILRLDGGVFERLGRYEASLWRQTVQIILVLNTINNVAPNDSHRHLRFKLSMTRRRNRWPPFTPP